MSQNPTRKLILNADEVAAIQIALQLNGAEIQSSSAPPFIRHNEMPLIRHHFFNAPFHYARDLTKPIDLQWQLTKSTLRGTEVLAAASSEEEAQALHQYVAIQHAYRKVVRV